MFTALYTQYVRIVYSVIHSEFYSLSRKGN